MPNTAAAHLLADLHHPNIEDACEPDVRILPDRTVIGRCLTHDVASVQRFATPDAALSTFRCDLGRGWRFIVHHQNRYPAAPTMVDLTGLYGEAEAMAQRATGGDHSDEIEVWRYLLDGTCQALMVELEKTGEDRYDIYIHAADGPVSEWPGDCDYTLDGATYLRTEIEFS